MYVSLYRPSALRPVSQVAIGHALDRLFGDWVVNPVHTETGAVAARRAPIDLIEKTDSFEALIDLPGVSKEDISVEIEGTVVQVTGAVKSTSEAASGDGERVVLTERSQAHYARRFELPVEVAQDSVTASLENGVLKLVLPKKEVARARRIEIQ